MDRQVDALFQRNLICCLPLVGDFRPLCLLTKVTAAAICPSLLIVMH